MLKNFYFNLIFFFVAATAFSQSPLYSRVVIDIEKEQLKELAFLGIALEGSLGNSGFVTELSAEALLKISALGYTYKTLIPDVKAHYVKQNEIYINNPALLKQKYSYCDALPYETPAGFSLGAMGGYYTYDELLAKLDSMHTHYPQLITAKQAIDTFNTVEGRPVYMLRISNNPNVTQNKPKVLYTALTHAREPASMQQLIFYMCYLLENYGSHPDVTNIVNNFELYFVPCVNPDGYIYNETTDPMGGGMWRKNRSNNGNGNYGVDLNRNFGYMWGYDNQGSSIDPSIDTYRGTAAFSEPESRLIKSLCEKHTFKICLNAHTYSNFLLYPWSYHQNLQNPDSLTYKKTSEILTAENKYTTGTGYSVLGYLANGDCIDWMYGDTVAKPKIIAFTPEIGSPAYGFWPPMLEIESICKANMRQNLYAAYLSGKFASISDVTPKIIGTHQNYFTFKIQNVGLDSLAQFTVSLQALSSNIQNVGTPKNFNNLAHLQEQTDSIAYNLFYNLLPADTVKFLVLVNNGVFTKSDTIVKLFGNACIVFVDSCSNLNNWTSGSWGLSTSQYVSAPASITDSPNGNYTTNSTRTITLQQNINLSNALYAALNFKTKFDVAAAYDYVQLTVSNNNGITWSPLCGKYTTQSGIANIEGEPSYEGRQINWLDEEIELNNYLGQNIKFRFTLKSDWYPWTKPDGFYFDDFTVRIIDTTMITSTSTINNVESPILLYPNPGTDFVNISFKDNSFANTYLNVYNSKAQLVYSSKLLTKNAQIPVMQWPKGVYSFRIEYEGKVEFVRFIKI